MQFIQFQALARCWGSNRPWFGDHLLQISFSELKGRPLWTHTGMYSSRQLAASNNNTWLYPKNGKNNVGLWLLAILFPLGCFLSFLRRFLILLHAHLDFDKRGKTGVCFGCLMECTLDYFTLPLVTRYPCAWSMPFPSCRCCLHWLHWLLHVVVFLDPRIFQQSKP